jgi:hypothetical protein
VAPAGGLACLGDVSAGGAVVGGGNVVAGGELQGPLASVGDVATEDVVATGNVQAATFNGAALPTAPTNPAVATAGANGQNLEVGSLTSGEEIRWNFEGEIITNSGATGVFTIEPNQLATNQRSGGSYHTYGGSALAGTDFTDLRIADNAGSGRIYFTGWIVQHVGRPRAYYLQFFQEDGATDYSGVWQGEWNVTTVITAIRIHSTNANGIRTGSWLRCWQEYRP